MSTTDTRLSLDEAVFHAEKFRAMFDPSTYVRWEFGGSLRRRSRDVGDLEHVVIPRIADLPGEDMFATPAPTNLLLRRLDELAAKLQVARSDYGGGKHRWGEKLRGCDFNILGATARHEVWIAEETNWGGKLAIYTGPADFSKRLVSGLLRNGRRNQLGHVWRCETCNCDRYGPACKRCDGTGLVPVERISTPTEESFFSLCGIAYTKPEARR